MARVLVGQGLELDVWAFLLFVRVWAFLGLELDVWAFLEKKTPYINARRLVVYSFPTEVSHCTRENLPP